MVKVDLNKIRTLRLEKGITQGEMSAPLGYKTAVGYHYLETGRCKITAEQLATIAKKLGVQVKDLYASETTIMVDGSSSARAPAPARAKRERSA